MTTTINYRLGVEGGEKVIAEQKRIADSGIAQSERQATAAERAAKRADAAEREALAARELANKRAAAVDPAVMRFAEQKRDFAAGIASMRAYAQEQEKLDRQARQFLSTLDPMFAAQERYNGAIRDADRLYKAGAISADQLTMAHRKARGDLDQHTDALARNAGVSGANRAAMQNLGFQVGDVAQQFALGTNPLIIFAQQAGQVTGALGGLTPNGKGGLSGAMASVITFLGGPWGVALSAGAVLLAAFAMKNDEASKASDKNKKSQESFTDAVKRQNEALRQNLQFQGQKIAADTAQAQAFGAQAIRDRATVQKGLDVLRSQLPGEEAALKSFMASGAGGAGSPGVAFAIARVDGIKAQIREFEGAIKKFGAIADQAGESTRLSQQALADRQVAGMLDPATKIRQDTEDAIAALRDQQRQGKITFDELTAGQLKLERAAKAATAALVGQAKAAGGDLPSSTAAAKWLRDQGMNVTSTTGGKHVKGSHHYAGRAVDFVPKGGMSSMSKADVRAMFEAAGFQIDELLGPGDKGHSDHFHVSWKAGKAGFDQFLHDGKMASEAQQELLADLQAVQGALDKDAVAAATYAEQLRQIARLRGAGKIDGATAMRYDIGAMFGARGEVNPLTAGFGAGSGDELKRQMAALGLSGDTRLDRANSAAQFATEALDSDRERIALLTAELGLTSARDDVRERELLKVRLMLDYTRAGGDAESERAKHLINSALAAQELQHELDRAAQAQSEWRNFTESALDRIFDPGNWKSWGDLGKSILRELQAEFVKLAVLNPLKNMLYGSNLPGLGDLFGGGGGGGGGLADSLVKSLIPGFGDIFKVGGLAVGTEYHPGGLTWVAENGPELVSLPRGSKVTGAAQTRRMLADAGGGMSFHMPISIDATGADAAGLSRVEAEVRDLKNSLPGRVLEVVGDARARTFGG